jgi:aminoglycoside phosphotransferase
MTGATGKHTGAGASGEPQAAGDPAMTAPVPVLVITGPVGVGKSTIANEAAWLLRQADVSHALVDLDRIEQCWPVPADDPWNERVSHRNLACMWANFRQAGADRLWAPEHLELGIEGALAQVQNIPTADHLVVCHGDACAPNTLIADNGRWSGHVDLGDLGVADRWADLAVATWSTEWNYGPGWEELLLDAYGIEPDAERTRYYRLLWELG